MDNVQVKYRKELRDLLKNTAIYIRTKEDSLQVQQLIFDNGGKWNSGSTSCLEIDLVGCYILIDRNITATFTGSSEDVFTVKDSYSFIINDVDKLLLIVKWYEL